MRARTLLLLVLSNLSTGFFEVPAGISYCMTTAGDIFLRRVDNGKFLYGLGSGGFTLSYSIVEPDENQQPLHNPQSVLMEFDEPLKMFGIAVYDADKSTISFKPRPGIPDTAVQPVFSSAACFVKKH